MKRHASKQYAILQRYPEPVLNNTTTNHLGNTPEPIEVFPPEIFFKGKFSQPVALCQRFQECNVSRQVIQIQIL